MTLSKRLLALGQSILIVFILAACSAQPAQAPAASNPAATPAKAAANPTAIAEAPAGPTPTMDAGDWRTIILNAFRIQRVKSWRYESDTVLENGTSGHTTVEFVPPDRYHITSKPNSEMIIIGQTVLAKQGAEWAKLDVPAASIVDPDAVNKLAETISNVQCGGPETVDGKPMYVCQYDSKTKIGDSDQPQHTKLWIYPDTNLPYKMIIDGAVGSMDSSTGKVTPVKATSTLLYTLDPSLRIDPPNLPN